MTNRLNGRGFTLIETIVVLTLLIVGVAIAVPNLMAVGRTNAVKAEARELKNLLAKTRMDAVERNQSLTATIDTTNHRCIVSAPGGAVISTTGFDDVKLASTPDPLAITWDTKGMTNDNCTIDLVGTDATFQVKVSSAGNIRIAKP